MNRSRLVSLAAASIAIAAGGAAGCNALVSAGDYHVEDTSGSGTDATTDTNPPPVTEAGPDTTVTDAGTDVKSDATPTCGSTFPTGTTDFTNLVRACFLHIGCSAFNYYGSTTIGQCIAEDSLNAFGGTRCERSAQTCDDILNCSGDGWDTACDGGAHTASCDTTNNIAHNCRNTNQSENDVPGFVFDCAKRGGTCKTYADDSGTYADCLVTGCNDPNDGTYHCAGNDLYYCVDDAGYGSNCQKFQATCSTAGGGGCFYNLPSCPADAGACNGNVGQNCFTDTNQLGSFNCAASGTVCDPTSDQATGYPFTCAAPGCDPSQCVEKCTGEKATVCVGGAPLEFDCTSVGMHCHELTDNSTPPITFAECSPFTQF